MRACFVRGCLVAAALQSWFPALAEELPSPLGLDDLVGLIRRRSPALAERSAMATAATARPRAAGLLEDPSVSLEWWQQPTDFSAVPLMLSVRQPLPWPGKLGARRAVAERQVATARDQVAEVALAIEAEGKRVYLDLVLAEDSLTINERVRALVDAMVTSAEARYRVGKAAQAVLLKTQGELLTLDNDRLDLERERDEARARINTLLDRAADAPLPPIEHAFRDVTLAAPEELLRRALAHRPEVRLAKDALLESEARLALAGKEGGPELAVWAGYMLNLRGTDTFTAGISSSLPVFSTIRQKALVSAEGAEVRARRAALVLAERRAEQSVRIALLQLDAARRHERLHSDRLIPLAEVALRSAEAAYENDRIDFFTVLDAARMLRDHHLNHARYLVEYQRRLVDLELATGEPLTVSR